MTEQFDDQPEQRRLAALQSYRLLDTAPEERLDRITVLVTRVFRVPTAVITMVDEHRQWFKSRVGLRLPETARDIAFCNTTIQGDAVTVVNDAELDPRFRANPLVTGSLGLRFYAGAPLRTNDGYNIGTLALIDYVPRTFSDDERCVLLELARFVMSELELWRRVHAFEAEHEHAVDEVTKRSRRERELAERRFRALVENAGDATLLLDAHGSVLYASPAAERVFGRAPSELLGLEVLELVADTVERGAIRSGVRQVLAESGSSGRFDTVVTTPSGARRHVSALVQNLLAEPAVGALVVHVRDISAEVEQRAELERLREQLRQAEKMEAIGRLAGGIAHDFNNLLTVILNNASFALARLGTDDVARDEVQQILRAGERGAALTQQILAFSRQRPVKAELVDPNQLVRGVMGLLGRTLGEQVELTFEADPTLPSVCIDRGQLEQVLINLCTNARDAMHGAGTLALRTSSCDVDGEEHSAHPWLQSGRYVTIAVRDTGEGIQPEHLSHVFEPFFTTKPAGRGTGLGLATAYGIVRQHGGFLAIDSVPGHGTEVRVHLPGFAATPEATRRSEPSRRPRGHGAVLLAEDSDLVRRVAQRVLEDSGYQVYAAADGAAAVELFRAHASEVRIAILDAVMPRLGGLAALDQLQAIRPDVPYLIVSGYELDGERVPDERWITKPYDVERLVSRVGDLLGD